LNAWNRSQADSYAKLFTEDGYGIGFDGSYHEGPERIATDLGEICAHHPTGAYIGKIR
jgi:uncharacterized protein (TIGR02246 family)